MNKKNSYDVLMFILLLVSLVLSFTNHPLAAKLDLFVILVFSLETFYLLFKSDHRWSYIKQHPFDFLSLLPIHPGFRAMKVVPLSLHFIRVTSIGKRYVIPVVDSLKKTGIGRFLWYFLLIFLILPLPLLWIEPAITHYSDLLWWSIQTVTTVGYGDIEIHTAAGKVVASLLMILGIGMISSFTSSVTRIMMDPSKKKELIKAIPNQKDVNFKLAELEQLEQLIQQEKQRLAEVEKGDTN